MNDKNMLYFIQINLNKSKQGQIEVAKMLRNYNKRQKKCTALVQEPMNAQNRSIYQPVSCQIFSKSSTSRTAIYIPKVSRGTRGDQDGQHKVTNQILNKYNEYE